MKKDYDSTRIYRNTHKKRVRHRLMTHPLDGTWGMVLYLLFDEIVLLGEPRRNTWLIWTACVSLGSFSFMPALLCLSLSICFVDIYGLVLLCRGLGRYPWEDDTYIYCFLL